MQTEHSKQEQSTCSACWKRRMTRRMRMTRRFSFPSLSSEQLPGLQLYALAAHATSLMPLSCMLHHYATAFMPCSSPPPHPTHLNNPMTLSSTISMSMSFMSFGPFRRRSSMNSEMYSGDRLFKLTKYSKACSPALGINGNKSANSWDVKDTTPDATPFNGQQGSKSQPCCCYQ